MKQEKDFSNVKEKFLPIAKELFSILEKILVKINNLEKEFETKLNNLNNTEFDEKIWKKYSKLYFEIISPNVTEKVIKKVHASSIWNPTTFYYIEQDYFLVAQMKSDKKAIFEFHFEYSISMKHQFIFIKENDFWKIDSIKYWFNNEKSWNTLYL